MPLCAVTVQWHRYTAVTLLCPRYTAVTLLWPRYTAVTLLWPRYTAVTLLWPRYTAVTLLWPRYTAVTLLWPRYTAVTLLWPRYTAVTLLWPRYTAVTLLWPRYTAVTLMSYLCSHCYWLIPRSRLCFLLDIPYTFCLLLLPLCSSQWGSHHKSLYCCCRKFQLCTWLKVANVTSQYLNITNIKVDLNRGKNRSHR